MVVLWIFQKKSPIVTVISPVIKLTPAFKANCNEDRTRILNRLTKSQHSVPNLRPPLFSFKNGLASNLKSQQSGVRVISLIDNTLD